MCNTVIGFILKNKFSARNEFKTNIFYQEILNPADFTIKSLYIIYYLKKLDINQIMCFLGGEIHGFPSSYTVLIIHFNLFTIKKFKKPQEYSF